MKPITINVSEPIYREFQAYAKSVDRTTSELIRQAMEEFRTRHLKPALGLLEIEPASAGKVLRPISKEDDLLGEMLHENRR